MTRRTWFRTITGAFATLATGLGLRKVGDDVWNEDDNCVEEFIAFSKRTSGDVRWLYARAIWNGEHWHFEDVKPEEET